jgi:hypothetical protein
MVRPKNIMYNKKKLYDNAFKNYSKLKFIIDLFNKYL